MTFVALTMHKKYDVCGFDNVACRFIYHNMTNDASLAKPVLWIVLQGQEKKPAWILDNISLSSHWQYSIIF